jgi:hypothetical protein
MSQEENHLETFKFPEFIPKTDNSTETMHTYVL